MGKTLLFSVLLLVFSGCANPYAKFYSDLSRGTNVLDDPRIVMPTNKPRLIQGSNIEKDTLRMMEDGYMILGESSFNAGPANQGGAVRQAAKIHADTVIVYSSYTGTITGSMPLTVPDQQRTYHSGSIYGSAGGFANYSGSSTTFGTRTMYMPYTVNRSDYYATYWVKIREPSLGVYFDSLTDELRKQVESNKGVYIIVVVKKSPAFDNDLLVGDIVRSLNNEEIVGPSHFVRLLDKNRGHQIELEIVRDGETIMKQIKLN